MSSFKKILVGVDLHHADRLADAELNPPTLTAIQRSIWLASQIDAEIVFCATLDLGAHTQEMLHEHFGEVARDVEDVSHRVLKGLVEQAAEKGCKASSKLMYGTPSYELLKESVLGKYDLVIVGTKDMGLTGRFLLGSTSQKLLRRCECPVWVTKPDPQPENLNVLVCSDFSDVSQEMINMIVTSCQTTDSKVHLLHVNETLADKSLWSSSIPEDQLEEYQKKQREQSEAKLNDQLSMTDFRTLKYGVKTHVIDGNPEEVIPKVVEQEGIDLIVLGTIGRSGIPGILIGNTAERILTHIDCSVLAVKPVGFECPVKFE
ncbi:Universal stress protein E [Polystyrenella longa]|uniref:Universal stress protein E n=1 Tax=Polystyrenella longa TaxID=2528007 RepID=A0A518CQN5_9PLAN|nr:universal stress protein [Polystyrenella longa]QDU81520.1 Universal stress protein E [Polystyrenella longa]